MTPDEIRDHAASIMLDHARDVERMSVREHLEDHDINWGGVDVQAILDLIAMATVTVEFPEEQP